MSAFIIFGLIALTLASVSVFRGYIFSPNQSLDLIQIVHPSINVLRNCQAKSLEFPNTSLATIAHVAAPSQQVKQQFSFEKHPKRNIYQIVYLDLNNQKWYLSYKKDCEYIWVFWSPSVSTFLSSYFEINPSMTKKAVYTIRAFEKDQTCNTRHLGISKFCSDSTLKLYPSSATEFFMPGFLP